MVNVNKSTVRLLMVIGLPPNVAVVPGVAKSDPETVTTWPPLPVPDDGVRELTDGRANVYRPTKVFQQEFTVAQLVLVTPSTSEDTTQTSVGCNGSCSAAE